MNEIIKKRMIKIKEILPWRLKIFLKIIFSRMPFRYSFWQKIGLFRHGRMDQATYVLKNFNEYCSIANLNQKDLKGKTLLELGPGDSIATALVAASYGAKTILVDVGHYAVNDTKVYQTLANELRLKGINAPNINSAQTLDEVLKICNAEYLTNGLDSLYKIKNNSVDLIVSQAVLEHIRKDKFLSVIQETKRVMNKKGNSVHTVDLKDHLSKALNNLRFQNSFWESKFISSSGFYTNRIRYSQMLQIFEDAGFLNKIINKNVWEEIPTSKKYIAHPFNLLTDDELCVSEFTVLLNHKK
jgi:SAM-dependent methyltransferase